MPPGRESGTRVRAARRSAWALALTAVLPPVGAGAQQPRGTFRSGRDVLTLQTSVRDADGRPVTDLQPADFSVRVDGEARTVLAARFFGPDAGHIAGSGVSLPGFTRAIDAPPGRIVVVAVDRDSIKAGSEKTVLDTAARMVERLSAADASGALALPVGALELTRDHARIADAIGKMSGTAPSHGWRHGMAWDEALAYERGDRLAINRVVERECPPGGGRLCAAELSEQSREMLATGRGHAQVVLTSMTDLAKSLARLRGPKHLVLISGGLPIEGTLLSRYQDLALAAAEAHVTLFVVQVDQSAFDVSDRTHGATLSGDAYAGGLASLAANTGGSFYSAAGRSAGIFDRVTADINHFYQIGLESRPADGNGKAHRIEVRVSRPNTVVRAPAAIAVDSPAGHDVDALARALAEPTDVAELPLEVASYSTHSIDAAKLRVIVSARTTDDAGVRRREWGYVITSGGAVLVSRRARSPAPAHDWAATDIVELPPGEYRLRVAVVDEDGRAGKLELPLRVGLRIASGVLASDVVLGTMVEGSLEPRAELRQDDHGVALIELSSADSLDGVTGRVELTRAGATAVTASAFELHVRETDKRIVVAEARLDLSAVPPARYTASALFTRDGTTFAKVSRTVDIVPGLAPTPSEPTPAPIASAPFVNANAESTALLQRVGDYVSNYGQQNALIVAVERYEQRYPEAVLGEPSSRSLVAEFALVKASDATGWVGFRDVIEVDRKPVQNRADRLEGLFKTDAPDVVEARRIADESARFNIGPTRRNFNEPTSMLFFLLPRTQQHFTFSAGGETNVSGVRAQEIDFTENTRPTLIRTAAGRDVPCHGTIWVIPGEGTVVRTRLVVGGFDGPESLSTVDVTYARDARLNMWLPVRMTERHESIVRRPIPGGGRDASSRDRHRYGAVLGFQALRDFFNNQVERSASVEERG